MLPRRGIGPAHDGGRAALGRGRISRSACGCGTARTGRTGGIRDGACSIRWRLRRANRNREAWELTSNFFLPIEARSGVEQMSDNPPTRKTINLDAPLRLAVAAQLD
jgi:hypothetical protein